MAHSIGLRGHKVAGAGDHGFPDGFSRRKLRTPCAAQKLLPLRQNPTSMRSICIHGHFYQPPRENPFLEVVELQDSAHPYHDWNERIAAECYAPNAVARIMDGGGRIRQLVNNYAWISFNFGPTLLAWMQGQRPDIYRLILDADDESRKRFSGHGSAL